MHPMFFMRWHIYTKIVRTDGGVGVRWFWRNPADWQESPTGFVTRHDCQTDAARHGYRPGCEERRRFRITPPRHRSAEIPDRRRSPPSGI